MCVDAARVHALRMQIMLRPTTNWDDTQLRFELYNVDPWSNVHSDDIKVEREELDNHKVVGAKTIGLAQLFQNLSTDASLGACVCVPCVSTCVCYVCVCKPDGTLSAVLVCRSGTQGGRVWGDHARGSPQSIFVSSPLSEDGRPSVGSGSGMSGTSPPQPPMGPTVSSRQLPRTFFSSVVRMPMRARFFSQDEWRRVGGIMEVRARQLTRNAHTMRGFVSPLANGVIAKAYTFIMNDALALAAAAQTQASAHASRARRRAVGLLSEHGASNDAPIDALGDSDLFGEWRCCGWGLCGRAR